MVKRNNKKNEPVHKLHELNANPAFGIAQPIPGFSVRIDISNVEHEEFKQQFRSDFFAIIVVTKGWLAVNINFSEYTVEENNLVVLSPNSIKQLIAVQPGTLASVIGFTADFITQIGMPKNITDLAAYFSNSYDPLWKLQPPESAAILNMFKQLEYTVFRMESHIHGKELIYHQLYILLYEMSALSKKYAKHLTAILSRKENLVVSFINLVQRQFKTQRSVKKYASQLNITPKYLTETVKEISGKTAGDIIDDYVIMEAKLYLNNPEYSIAQIASELNFADQSFFGKFFKRHSGLSPKEYRQVF